MSRKKGSDSFGFKDLKSTQGFDKPSNVFGADNSQQLIKPLPFKRRFRPATGTKDFSILSDYDYSSRWVRWRRGYDLACYSQETFGSLSYSFKYFITTPGVGIFLPGIAFMYPTTRADMRMWMVGIRPRDSFNFLNFGYAISSVTDYDPETYAVRLNSEFGPPITYFTGEVLSNRFNADGTQKNYGYSNYTVKAIGINGVPVTNPGFLPIYNTLFLSHKINESWTVVDVNRLAVPAVGPPAVGEYLTTEMRSQCTCPDYLARENLNLYEESLRQRYPYTRVQNFDPGFYDAGPDQGPDRIKLSIDDPGYARTFGFIYLNQLYNIPQYSEEVYSDPNLFYYQPRWCKHIYAAMWQLKSQFNQGNTVDYWLPQPSDEPMNEYYREKLEIDLSKQAQFLRREKNLVWWQRYGVEKDKMPARMMQPDMYNMMTKTLNAGDIDSPSELEAVRFQMFDIDEYDPFAPINFDNLDTYDGGTYANGVLVSQPVNVLAGGEYANGTLIPYPVPPSQVSLINGGTYT